MAARGYATLAQIAAYYGSALTPAQQTQANLWMEPAEELIDQATGNPFLLGPVVGEQHTREGPLVWLKRRPVTDVPHDSTHGSEHSGASLNPPAH